MAEYPHDAHALDYQHPGTPPPRLGHVRRSQKVIAVGAAIALIGVILFFRALSWNTRGASLPADDARVDELLSGALGLTLLLGGMIIAALGLAVWCREDAG